MFAIQYICSHNEVSVHVGKRFRSIKESITQLSQNSNEMNNDTLNTRTRGTLLQRSNISVTAYGHVPECRIPFGRGYFILLRSSSYQQ